MSRSIVPLAIAALLLVLVANYVLLSDSQEESARRAVQDAFDQYAEKGRATITEYVDVLESSVDRSLRKLFAELDKDGDGCIRKDEFHGVSIGLVAAVSSVKMPSLPIEVPSLPEFNSSLSFAKLWVGSQFLFLCLLYVIEHIRVVFGYSDARMFGPPKRLPTAVGRDRALLYDTPLTNYERCKMLFFTLTGLVFLRLFLMVFFFTCAVTLINLSVYRGRTRSNAPVWFALCAMGVKLFGNLLLASMGFYHIKVQGKLATRSECKLLVGNHVCMVELVYLYLAADFPAFVSRVENLSVPLFRGVVAASDAIIVDRDAASSRLKTLAEIRRRSKDIAAAQLMIFPEGTCNNQLALFDFRKGAFEPGDAVQPCCFYFPYKHFNPAWTGRAVGGNDFLDLMFRLLTQFVNRLEVRILPVHTPTSAEKTSSTLYAKNIQQLIADAIGLSSSDASYADYVQAIAAYNRGVVVKDASSASTSPAMKPLDLDAK